MERVESQDIETVKRRIPERCPSCWECDGVVATDFKVFVAYPFRSYDGEWLEMSAEPEIRVECERCDEEIREEDIIRAKRASLESPDDS